VQQWMERPSAFIMEFIVGVVEGIFEDQVREQGHALPGLRLAKA
jgi:hypothetical protein